MAKSQDLRLVVNPPPEHRLSAQLEPYRELWAWFHLREPVSVELPPGRNAVLPAVDFAPRNSEPEPAHSERSNLSG